MDNLTTNSPPERRTSISFSNDTTPPRAARPLNTDRTFRRPSYSIDEALVSHQARISSTSQVIHGTTLSYDAALSPDELREARERQASTASTHTRSEIIPLEDMGHSGEYVHRIGTASSEVSHTWIGSFWVKYIKVTVPEWACRDHFALERTVLGYIRTSSSFAMLGVTIAQFMRLSNNGDTDPTFGFFKVAIPLASVCYITALIILMLGTIRFYRWQWTIAYGYSLSSGWEFLTIVTLSFAVLITIFVLNTAITVQRS